MDNLARMQLTIPGADLMHLQDCLESAKAAIMAKRYPYGDWPEELEARYIDLQYRAAVALYNKRGGEYETSHIENGVTRVYGSEGIPEALLMEVTPLAKVTN